MYSFIAGASIGAKLLGSACLDNAMLWNINGVHTNQLIEISPEELAVDNSLRTAESEFAYSQYQDEFEKDLQRMDPDVLKQFKDGVRLLSRRRELRHRYMFRYVVDSAS